MKTKLKTIDDYNGANNRKKLLIGLLVLLLLAVGVGAYFYSYNKSKNHPTGDKLSEQILAIRGAKDCRKGLDDISSYNVKAGDQTKPEVQGNATEVLQYRIDCNFELKDYKKALKSADELMKLYDKYGGLELPKQQLAEQINTIKITQETEKLDKENEEKSKNAKEIDYGPRL